MSLHELHESLEDSLADPILDAQLDVVLNADPETVEQVRGAFRIDTLDAADWAARKIERFRRRLAEAEEVAAAQIQRAQEWLSDQQARCDRDTEFLVSLLEGYHRSVLEDDPRAKTVELPSGAKLVARKQPDQWAFDGEAFLVWAQSNRVELVRTKVEVDKVAAKKALANGVVAVDVDNGGGLVVARPGQVLTPEGELVPGVEVTPGPVKFAVKTGADQ